MRNSVRLPKLNWFGVAGQWCILLLALAPVGCRKPPEPVTITFFDPEGLLGLGENQMISGEYLKEFTQETGIRVNQLPTPQSNRAQLSLATELLQSGASTPDVYGVDTIWSGTLSEYLVDLQPYFASALPSQDPDVLASYKVRGRLVAMPYHPSLGVLYYRADLLQKYGYNRPPRTWEELEKMASRIQAGERTAGKKDFWGFVWPGTNGEPLSDMGVEWQMSEGGGSVIEPDRKISVNNPDAIHAWERATHWVGWISPPSVLSYTEWDSSNVFWSSGNAAFTRGWSDFFQRLSTDMPFRQQAGVTSVPAGKSGRVSALGGYALGVSRYSAHRIEAIKLVNFLINREAQHEAVVRDSKTHAQIQLYELPSLLERGYPWAVTDREHPGGRIVSRPSAVAGLNYTSVSIAYVNAVRSVLMHQSTAPAAAAKLEKELIRITGFETEPR